MKVGLTILAPHTLRPAPVAPKIATISGYRRSPWRISTGSMSRAYHRQMIIALLATQGPADAGPLVDLGDPGPDLSWIDGQIGPTGIVRVRLTISTDARRPGRLT